MEEENPDAEVDNPNEFNEDADAQEAPEVEDVITASQQDQEEKVDFQEDVAEKQQDDFYNPYQTENVKDSIYTFFREILGLDDSSKVANLDKRELGNLNLSVRNYEYLSYLGKTLGDNDYSKFFAKQGEIVLATSMSKRGWLPELVVSQKRFSQRTVNPIRPMAKEKGFLGLVKSQTPAQQ